MIFVDTNVFMYAVGRDHPHRETAQAFFLKAREHDQELATSAEVIQELMHAYIPVERITTLDAALELMESSVKTIWPLEWDDLRFARALIARHQELSARDLVHLACCKRRHVDAIQTFDRGLAAAFRR